MKSKFLTLAFGLLSSATVFAGSLPGINNVKIIVDGLCTTGPGTFCPAVMPWTSIEFDYVSCAQMNFNAETVEISENSVEVSIVLEEGAVDCFGPTSSKSYKVQVAGHADFSRQYIIKNPLVIGATN